MPKRFIWDLLLLTAGITYVVMALCDSVESLPFVVLFVGLAAQALVHAHRE